jgi:Queuosine biosynthesis protein QueC
MIGLLLSGGMDSISIAWWKRPDIAITIDYGQRAGLAEVEAAVAVCLEVGIKHEIVRVDCSSLGSGDMAGRPPISIAPGPGMVAISQSVAFDARGHCCCSAWRDKPHDRYACNR